MIFCVELQRIILLRRLHRRHDRAAAIAASALGELCRGNCAVNVVILDCDCLDCSAFRNLKRIRVRRAFNRRSRAIQRVVDVGTFGRAGDLHSLTAGKSATVRADDRGLDLAKLGLFELVRQRQLAGGLVIGNAPALCLRVRREVVVAVGRQNDGRGVFGRVVELAVHRRGRPGDRAGEAVAVGNGGLRSRAGDRSGHAQGYGIELLLEDLKIGGRFAA